MDQNGGSKRLWAGNLSESPAELTWAADGSGVYFTVGEKGSNVIYFAPLQGELRKLTEQQPKAPKKGAKLSPTEVDTLIADVRALYERAGSAVPPAKHHDTKKKPDAKTAPPSPQDPYDPARALNSEVDLQALRSQTAFDRCYDEANAAQAIHGELSVAFQVLTDGRVANASAVENTTGSAQLGTCLAGIIGRWSFATHPAASSSFVRPFSYR